MVLDFTTPCEVAIKCSLLSESLRIHIALVNDESVLATGCRLCALKYTVSPNSAMPIIDCCLVHHRE